MKKLVKIAALVTGIATMTACSWFSEPSPVADHPNPQIDTTIQTSVNDSSKTDTSVTETQKDTSTQVLSK